jgi:hypothetical protein
MDRTSSAGTGTSPTRDRSRGALSQILLPASEGAVIGMATVLVALSQGVAPGHLSTTWTVRPFELNATTQVIRLSFPNCTLVSLHMRTTEGGATNFSVWEPGPIHPSGCGQFRLPVHAGADLLT